MSTAATEGRPRKPAQRRSQETRDRLVEAAVEEFADRGFEGASTRNIAARAGVAQSALPYHFTTKEALWKAAADRLFGDFRERFAARIEGLEGVDAGQRARLLLADFVRYVAGRPAMHRFMLQEGTHASDRLSWLVETHVRPMAEGLREVFADLDDAERGYSGRFEHFYYLLIGAVTTPYALAAEFRLLMGADPFDEEHVEEHVASLVELLFPDPARRAGAQPSETEND